MGIIKTQTFSGIKWIFAMNIAQKAISFGTTIILARILKPADFGLFALAFVLIDALGLFKSLGVDYALIRRKEDSNFDKAANTAFILIPVFGIFLFIILCIIAPLGAKFLGNQSLASIVRILGIIFIIGCLGRVPDAILNRRMQFREKSIAEIIGGLVYSLCAVILAFFGFGVWSLVIGYVIQVFIQIGSYWYFAKWRPKFEFDKKLAIEMLHYGKYIIAGSLVGFIRSNLDNLVVGKILGVTQLGFYAMAFSLANFSSEYLISKLSRVLFPAFSKLHSDREYFGEVFLRVEKYIAIIAIPFGIGLFLVGPAFLKIMYGDKWLPAIEILKILSIAAIFKALNSAVGPAILAAGKSKLDFYLNLLQAFLFFVVLIPAVHYFKILGAGYAVIFSTITIYLISLLRIRRVLDYTFIKLLDSFKPAVLSAAVMFFVIKLLQIILTHKGIFNIPSLITTIIISGFIYLISVALLDKIVFKELREMLFSVKA